MAGARLAGHVSSGNRPTSPHDPNRDAFHAETLALFGSVHRVARRLTGNSADADDLTQETYVRALGASDTFRWGTNLKAWLFTILRNLNRNRARDRARALRVADGQATEGLDAADSSDTAETRLVRESESRELRVAIESLPPSLRQTVWLRDVEELTYAEIARRLNIPIGTVMSRLSRARALLYRHITAGAGLAVRRPRPGRAASEEEGR
jgi:RNA polymerase sigma-70 factor (ECF subfamily)